MYNALDSNRTRIKGNIVGCKGSETVTTPYGNPYKD